MFGFNILGQIEYTESCLLIAFINYLILNQKIFIPKEPTWNSICDIMINYLKVNKEDEIQKIKENLMNIINNGAYINVDNDNFIVHVEDKYKSIFQNIIIYNGHEIDLQNSSKIMTNQKKQSIINHMKSHQEKFSIFYSKFHFFTLYLDENDQLFSIVTNKNLWDYGAIFQDLEVYKIKNKKKKLLKFF